uniref:HTH psq-type domain-containing protein n=1 Tax=Graphocephala atropunctata TaxID=36148 RepID=A0A1B6L3R6_9HEMI
MYSADVTAGTTPNNSQAKKAPAKKGGNKKKGGKKKKAPAKAAGGDGDEKPKGRPKVEKKWTEEDLKKAIALVKSGESAWTISRQFGIKYNILSAATKVSYYGLMYSKCKGEDKKGKEKDGEKKDKTGDEKEEKMEEDDVKKEDQN